MNKELQKAIIIRSKLQNKFSKNRTESNKKVYCKQRNISVNILCKTKNSIIQTLRLVK